jgi:hypothetical protein
MMPAAMITVTTLVAVTLLQSAATSLACPRCRWTPPAGRTVDVRSTRDLERAVADARAGDTILLEDGEYVLRAPIVVAVPKVTLRSRRGDAAAVTLRGRGMTGDSVGVGVAITASDVAVADITIRDVGYHAIQVHGERGASRFMLHNARLSDAGQQLFKVSIGDGPVQANGGVVACSEFSYATSAPSDYTNGVDILRNDGWVIRDNRFLRIRGPEAQGWRAGPTILAWAGAQDTIVERNVIVDSFRGIALGLSRQPTALRAGREYDHLRGIVRDNTIVNLNAWTDEAVEANDAHDVRIERNTIVVGGTIGWSIGVRFPQASAYVGNNVMTRPVLERDGGHATAEGNLLISPWRNADTK